MGVNALILIYIIRLLFNQATDSLSDTVWKHPLNKQRYVARIMYDGTRFRGWQDVRDIETEQITSVQGYLRKTLSKRFSTETIVTGASRTDAGVHARGQAIHFDVDDIIENIDNFEFTLNRVLPTDIRIYNVSIAPPGSQEDVDMKLPFHATKSAIGKYYSYTFCTNKYVDPLLRSYCGHMYFPVDIEKFKYHMNKFVGTHDFSAFTNQVNRKQKEFSSKNMTFSTIKTINSIDIESLSTIYGNGYYRVDINVNSALYRMLRNIIWACAYTAADMMTESQLDLLLTPDLWYTHGVTDVIARTLNKAKPAPPEGLCLEHVYYDHY